MERFFEVAPDATVILQEDGSILHANRRFRKLVAPTVDTCKLSFTSDLVHEDDRGRVLAACEQAARAEGEDTAPIKLAAVHTLVLGENGDFPVYELWDWMLAAGVQGLGGVAASGRPVRDKEKEEHEIELQDFLNKAPIAMHWLSGTGHVLWANDTELQVLGYTREEYIGQPIMQFVDADDSDLVLDIFKTLGSGNAIRDVPVRFRNKAGKLVDLLIDSNVNWNADGSFRHTRCFIRDDTNRKVREARLQARAKYSEAVIREKDSFLRCLIHEIRTPIHILTQVVENISSSPHATMLGDLIEDAMNQCSRVSSITQDVADAALFEDGMVLKPTPQIIDSRLFLSEAVDAGKLVSMRGGRSKEGTEVRVKVSNSVPKAVECDGSLLRRVIGHLVCNAVECSADHGVVVEMGYDGANLSIAVSDHGPGMDAAQVERAFHAYYRSVGDWDDEEKEDATSTWQRLAQEAKGGLGIGLNLSYNVVQCLGGELRMEPVEGGGCKFYFSTAAPAAASDVPQNASPKPTRTGSMLVDTDWTSFENTKKFTAMHYVDEGDSSSESGSGPLNSTTESDDTCRDALHGAVGLSAQTPISVLLVDDSPMAVKILKKTLVKLNCNVVTAFNGFEACNIMETMGNVFDVILMDLRMPIMDGHSAVMQIRAMGHADVNIHMVTAEAGQDFRDKCLRNGADGYLVKPVNKASLNEVLEIVKKDRLKQLRLPGLNLSPNRNTMGPGLAALQQQ